MIAGFIGLAMGEQGLGILPFSTSIGSYAGVLIILVLPLSESMDLRWGDEGAGEEVKGCLASNMYRFCHFFLQFIIPITVTLTVIKAVNPEVKSGHRNFAGIGLHGRTRHGGGLQGNLCRAWLAGSDRFGMTFATIGILTGFWRPGFVKWATSKGYTGYIKGF